PALSTCFFSSSIVVIFLRADARNQAAGLNAHPSSGTARVPRVAGSMTTASADESAGARSDKRAPSTYSRRYSRPLGTARLCRQMLVESKWGMAMKRRIEWVVVLVLLAWINGVASETSPPSPLLAIDQHRATVIDRVVTQWGNELTASTAGLSLPQ